MNSPFLALGIDLGTSGVRLAILNELEEVLYFSTIEYPQGLEHSEDWKTCCEELIQEIPFSIKRHLKACAVDGTSGTLLACNLAGEPFGKALPYYESCPEQEERISIFLPNGGPTSSLNSSLAKGLALTDRYGKDLILRHQADWINGWLIGNWDWGEESNNFRMGWDVINKCWPSNYKNLGWEKLLPKIISSGSKLGRISLKAAQKLSLPKSLNIIAGTTDSNASVLATGASSDAGVTILGSTIVLKKFVKKPCQGMGITNHLVEGRWLCGGASNAGGAVLKKFFTNKDIAELSNQINPELDTGIRLLPLPCIGERFPINDPHLKPILGPRPISDALFLHALFEGLASIEAEGWLKLKTLGIDFPTKIITIGGGANNPQWRRIRERRTGIQMQTCKKQAAYGIALLALRSMQKSKSL